MTPEARLNRLERLTLLIVRAGARARREMNEKINILIDMQMRTEERVAKNEERFARNEERLARLSEQTNRKFLRMAEAQVLSDQKIAKLAEAQAQLADGQALSDQKLAKLAEAQVSTDRKLTVLIDIVSKGQNGDGQ